MTTAKRASALIAEASVGRGRFFGPRIEASGVPQRADYSRRLGDPPAPRLAHVRLSPGPADWAGVVAPNLANLVAAGGSVPGHAPHGLYRLRVSPAMISKPQSSMRSVP